MNREQAQRWLENDLTDTQRVEQARLHGGGVTPEQAQEIRTVLVLRQETIENVTNDIANGYYDD